MPTVLRVGPYRPLFYSNENNEPPHIHVESGDKAAKFWLVDAALARNNGYNSREVNAIRNTILENAVMLMEAWNEHFEG